MKGGLRRHKLESVDIIRVAGLVTPVILLLYGVPVLFEYIPGSPLLSPPLFCLLALTWLGVATWQFLRPGKTKRLIMLRLSLYYLLSGIYLLGVTGVATPLVACWILLIIASSVYFGKAGVRYGVLGFLVIVGLDIALWYSRDTTVVMYDLAVLAAVLLSGFVAISVAYAQTVDQLELKRIKAQESLQNDRIMTLVNNLADAILSTDSTGVVRVYNASSLNLLDTNDSLNGRHIDDVLPLVDGEDKPVAVSTLLDTTKGVQTFDDLWYQFQDGEKLRLEVTMSPIRNTFRKRTAIKKPVHDGYILIMRDITKAKSLEEERDEFISVVSHELRTPTTIVEGTLSNLMLLADRPGAVQKELLKENLQTAHEQTLFLARMVNDLSTLSRAERGVADDPEKIDVTQLAHKLFETYQDEAAAKGLTFNLDIAPTAGSVVVSRLYLEELLQNFITNAIKYTKEGSVTLAISVHKDDVYFAVKDTGIGMSKTDQARVFEKFYRSEDYRTRETGGTGLGLYVAAKLAKKMHTTITLSSRLNHGSTFGFSLPRIDETARRKK